MDMAFRTTVSAPGKIIISGEHVVVYGFPALVAAIDKRIKIKFSSSGKKRFNVFPESSKLFVEEAFEILRKHIKFSSEDLEVVIKSDIPIGRGMGSSAAFAVALSLALFERAGKGSDLDKISELAYELEKKYHGNPSGVDISISTYGGILWYRKETEDFKTFSNVNVKKSLPEIFLHDTGKPEESTKETVAYVSSLLKNKPSKTKETFGEIEKVTRAMLQYLIGEKKYDFTDLVRTNEKLLENLGVVSFSTRDLIRKIERSGGAAKMSGGGGIKGASGIILVYHKDTEKLFKLMKKENLKIEKAFIGEKGVTIEKSF